MTWETILFLFLVWVCLIVIVKAISPPSIDEVIRDADRQNPYRPSRFVPLIDTKKNEWVLWDNKKMERVKGYGKYHV